MNTVFIRTLILRTMLDTYQICSMKVAMSRNWGELYDPTTTTGTSAVITSLQVDFVPEH